MNQENYAVAVWLANEFFSRSDDKADEAHFNHDNC
jgi:hypothetical protein